MATKNVWSFLLGSGGNVYVSVLFGHNWFLDNQTDKPCKTIERTVLYTLHVRVHPSGMATPAVKDIRGQSTLQIFSSS